MLSKHCSARFSGVFYLRLHHIHDPVAISGNIPVVSSLSVHVNPRRVRSSQNQLVILNQMPLSLIMFIDIYTSEFFLATKLKYI